MRNDMIRQMVRDLFDTIGEVAVSATLRQKAQGDYEPGSGAAETTTDTAIRLVRTEKSLSDAQNMLMSCHCRASAEACAAAMMRLTSCPSLKRGQRLSPVSIARRKSRASMMIWS